MLYVPNSKLIKNLSCNFIYPIISEIFELKFYF